MIIKTRNQHHYCYKSKRKHNEHKTAVAVAVAAAHDDNTNEQPSPVAEDGDYHCTGTVTSVDQILLDDVTKRSSSFEDCFLARRSHQVKKDSRIMVLLLQPVLLLKHIDYSPEKNKSSGCTAHNSDIQQHNEMAEHVESTVSLLETHSNKYEISSKIFDYDMIAPIVLRQLKEKNGDGLVLSANKPTKQCEDIAETAAAAAAAAAAMIPGDLPDIIGSSKNTITELMKSSGAAAATASKPRKTTTKRRRTTTKTTSSIDNLAFLRGRRSSSRRSKRSSTSPFAGRGR